VVSNIIFRIILVLLPSQLGLHLWPEYSRILGLKIDYLSPTIYLTHLLIVFLLVINNKKISIEIKKHFSLLKIIFILIFVNIYFSINIPLTSLKWIEFSLYFLFFLYLKNRKNLLQKNLKYLYISIFLVFGIQLLQLAGQKSLGGLFYWLGERGFDASTPNLPKYQFIGREFVRTPSLFSHANSLAGFMFLSLLSLRLFNSNFYSKIITLASIIVSGSKNVILFLPLYLIKKTSLKKVLIGSLLITMVLINFSQTLNSSLYTISSRLSGISHSTEVIKNHLIFGTGLGSYLNGLDDNLTGSQITYENLQPVHNIYLLLLSEFGLVGVTLLGITFYFSKISPKQSLILSAVLLTGLFDHYWLTLVQNKMLLTILLASFPVEYET